LAVLQEVHLCKEASCVFAGPVRAQAERADPRRQEGATGIREVLRLGASRVPATTRNAATWAPGRQHKTHIGRVSSRASSSTRDQTPARPLRSRTNSSRQRRGSAPTHPQQQCVHSNKVMASPQSTRLRAAREQPNPSPFLAPLAFTAATRSQT
jgi:hypothetical protein